MDYLFVLFASLLFILNIADILTTHQGLKYKGVVEDNALVRVLMGTGSLWIAIKVLGVMLFIWFMHPSNTFAVFVACLIYAFVVASNWFILRKRMNRSR